MKRESIFLVCELGRPTEEVFDYFAAHENQAEIFSIRVERLKNGADDRNGVGSMRRIHSPPLPPFEETITVFERHRLIEYRMGPSWRNPIRDHVGRIVFAPSDKSGVPCTRLEYTIRFLPRLPLTGGMIRTMTERNLKKGLNRLELKFALAR